MALPPCGMYRTTQPIAGVPAGRLVYFHNHGDPGPGVYLPSSWHLNRAEFRESGYTLTDPSEASSLEPLRAEGLYRVGASFTCCEQRCVVYQQDQLVQVGYDGSAQPILFLPAWSETGLTFPEVGHLADESQLQRLVELLVADEEDEEVTHAPPMREDLH